MENGTNWTDEFQQARTQWRQFVDRNKPTTPIRGRTIDAWLKECTVEIPQAPDALLVKELVAKVANKYQLVQGEMAVLSYFCKVLNRSVEQKIESALDQRIESFRRESPSSRMPSKETFRAEIVARVLIQEQLIALQVGEAELEFFKRLSSALFFTASQLSVVATSNAHLLKIHEAGWNPTTEE